MGQKTRKPWRDFERELLYEAVTRHRAAGLSYSEIIRSVEDEFRTRPSKSHVSNWVRSDQGGLYRADKDCLVIIVRGKSLSRRLVPV